MNERISAGRRWIARTAAAFLFGLCAQAAWAIPTFTTPAVTTATQGAAYQYDIQTSDTQGGDRLITAPVLPTWLTLSNVNQNQGRARISGTPTQAQVGVPQAVTLLVTNTTTLLTATQIFTITVANVNDAPTITSVAVTSVNEDAPYTYNITSADPDTGGTRTISATTLPSWLALTNVNASAGTATLTGTPAQAQVGTHNVVLRVTDNGSPVLFGTQSFTITVANTNDAPTFTSTAPTGASQGSLYTYSITTADPDTGGTRTVSVAPSTSLPSWLSLGSVNPTAGTATLSGTPGQTQIGTFSVTLRVTDNGSPALFATQAFTITVNNTNDPPTFTSVAVTAATEDVVYTYNITTADPDTGDARTISAPSALPAWLTLTNVNPTAGTATLSGTPLQANVGAHSITLRVTDNGTPTPLFANQTFTITVANANDAPRIVGPIPAQLAVENAPFQLLSAAGAPTTLAAFFADDDVGAVLTYQVTGLPPGGRLVANATTGAITGTPLAADARDTPYPIQVTVSDGVTLPASQPTQTFNLTVSRTDRADVSVTTTVAPTPALRNVNVDWTFTVANAGPQTASPINFTAEFAGNPFSFTALGACSVTPAGDRQVVSCPVPALAAAGTSVIVISGQAAQAGDVHVTANAQGAAATPVDPNLTNNRVSTTLNVAQALTSGPAQLLPSPDNVSAATGDFNRDGFIDLALTKGSASGTEVYLNVESTTNPAQRMLSPSPLVLGDQLPSTDVLAADLDGDGDLDLVTTNNTAQSNNVFLNSGTGAFTLFATLGAGDSNAAAAGDFNGDGRLDLAFAGPAAAAIYLNAPGPTFTPATPVGTGNMRELVVADFDLDGLPDLVLANAAGPSRFHKNLGGGQFAAGVVIDSGGAESVASADFNGDSRPDLAFARVGTAVMPPSIVVYQNNPGGTAPLFVIVAGLGAAPTLDVLATDVDLDSFADLVAVGASGTHQVYRGNGAGGFSLHPTQFLLTGATGAAFGKLSIDDRVDLAVAGTGGAGVFFNDGRGGLGPGDTDKPVIQLVGEASVEVEVGTTYQDSGATATDSIDGNLTTRIVTNNPVNPRIVGTYTVTYDVTDNSGNAASRVTRSVRVGAREGTGGGGGGAVDAAVVAALMLLYLGACVRRRARSRAC